MVQYGVNGHLGDSPHQGALVGPTIPTGPRGEKTVGQVLIGSGPDGMLPPGALALNPVAGTAWYRKARLMRRDSTLGFLRDIYQAPILGAQWTVTATEPRYEPAVKMVEESFLPHRDQFLYDAVRGFLDFGWAPYEMVKHQHEDGSLFVSKMKGLLPDLTTVLVDYYGALLGVRNVALHNVINPNPVYLFRGDCVVLSRDVEGTNWYSEALMRRAERPYDSWNDCDDAARRFDNKVAGATWVVYYPVGSTRMNGVITDNGGIAQAVLDALYSSGKVAIPQEVLRFTDELNTMGPEKALWRVELISAQTQQSFFVDRLKYVDSTKARAVGFPERAILEGQFGTKAEAEVHADFAIDNIEMTHGRIVSGLNQQGVNFLLEVNCGAAYRDKVRIEAMPLNDAKRSLLKQLFLQHFANPDGQAMRSDRMDWDAIQDELGVPQVQNAGGDHEERFAGGGSGGGGSGVGGLSRRRRYLAGLRAGRRPA